MRLILGCILPSCLIGVCLAGEPRRTLPQPERQGPSVRALLREAAELTCKQNEKPDYSTDGLLIHIGQLQLRIGDFDGALHSIRSCNFDDSRDEPLVTLAEAFARDGKRVRALEVLKLVHDEEKPWLQVYHEESVQKRWIEHLIASRNLGEAAKAVEKLRFPESRHEVYRELAAGHARSGDKAGAAKQFELAIDAALGLDPGIRRVQAISEIGDAQLAVGYMDAAKATIQILTEKLPTTDWWVKHVSLCRAAELSAKMKDEQAARRLFARALETKAYKEVALAQASVGLIDGAVKTASMMKDAVPMNSDCDEVLHAIAVAQLKGNDAGGAVQTASAIRRVTQYRDHVLRKVIDRQIEKQDLKSALSTTEKFSNKSSRAAAMLKIATAYARTGDPDMAKKIAAQIELTCNPDPNINFAGVRFDYRLPRTWPFIYEFWRGSDLDDSLGLRQPSLEVAEAAMTLAQALHQKPAQSYAKLFDPAGFDEMQALARAHAASGDPREALEWVRRIDKDPKDKEFDPDGSIALYCRIHALIGVAEGILSRIGVDQTRVGK